MLHVCVYINDLVVIRNNNFENYMDLIDTILICLKNYEMQSSVVQQTLYQHYVSYMNFMVTWEGIKYKTYKVRLIMGIKYPKKNYS